MSNNENNDLEKEPLKKKLEDLIRKKSDENNALKKLLEGLNKTASSPKKNK